MMNLCKKLVRSVPQGLFQPQRPFSVDCSSLVGWPVSICIALDQSSLILPFAQPVDKEGKE